MIDVNRDGYVDRDDLQDIMVSLGMYSASCVTNFPYYFDEFRPISRITVTVWQCLFKLVHTIYQVTHFHMLTLISPLVRSVS